MRTTDTTLKPGGHGAGTDLTREEALLAYGAIAVLIAAIGLTVYAMLA